MVVSKSFTQLALEKGRGAMATENNGNGDRFHRRVARLAMTGLAALLGSGIVLGLVQANVQEWAKAQGQDQYLVRYAGPIMTRLAEITQSSTFLAVAWAVIGGSLVLWIDYALRRRTKKMAIAIYVFAFALACLATWIVFHPTIEATMAAPDQPSPKVAPQMASDTSQPRPTFDNSGTVNIDGATFNGSPPPGFIKNEGTFSGRGMTVSVPQNKPSLFFSWTDETRALSTAELIAKLNVVAKELREKSNEQDWISSAHRGRDLVGAALHKDIKYDISSGAIAISLVHVPNKAAANDGADFLSTIATTLAAKK